MMNKCKDCMFYQFQATMKDGTRGGICRRFPPHPTMLQQIAQPTLAAPSQQPQIIQSLQGFFPPVAENEVCGEWSACWIDEDSDEKE